MAQSCARRGRLLLKRAAAGMYKFGGSAEGFASFGIVITHMQVVSTFSGLNVHYPSQFKEVIGWIGDVLMFRLDGLAHPECSFQVSPFVKWCLFLCTPFYFALLYLLWYGLSRLCFRDNIAALAAVKSKCQRTFIQVLYVLYLFIVSKSLDSIDCSYAYDGAPVKGTVPAVLDSNSSIECSLDDPIWIQIGRPRGIQIVEELSAIIDIWAVQRGPNWIVQREPRWIVQRDPNWTVQRGSRWIVQRGPNRTAQRDPIGT